MKKLEHLARDLFIEYSLKVSRKPARWDYLRNDRKIEWVKEVVVMFDYVYKEIKNSISGIYDDGIIF